jgi:hypothetical protein
MRLQSFHPAIASVLALILRLVPSLQRKTGNK